MYRNLRVTEGDKEKLMFVFGAGQFATLTMSFGLIVEPGYFHHLKHNTPLGRIRKFMGVYVYRIKP